MAKTYLEMVKNVISKVKSSKLKRADRQRG